MASASGYNHHRFARAVLKKSRKWEPSLTVQLFHNHWRFEHSPVTFQYTGPMTPFLLALRSQVIPASLVPFLYDIRPPVSFVDGCLVVEMQDFRRTPETKIRMVMRPAAEALAQTVDVMLERRGERWDEVLALELESRIIAATSPPLYLGTSILATRNATLAMTLTSPAGANLSAEGGFRQPGTSFAGDEKTEVERMRKILCAGERSSTSFQPAWNILRLKERLEAQRQAEKARIAGQLSSEEMASAMGGPPASQPIAAPIGSGAGGGAGAAAGGDKPKKPKKKRPADDGEETKKPPVKKKKTATDAANANTAGSAAAATATTGGEVKKKKPAPKKKKKEAEAAA